jgi:glucose-1-phosphate cytidylyltransferase
MKVVILAGGLGTRLSEYTEAIPKPMVEIGGKPILWHIMKNYAEFDHKEFYIALGYKGEKIKEYFLNFKALNSDFYIDLKNNEMKVHNVDKVDWKINLIQTGQETMTGGRLKRLTQYINDDTFMLTYGDGLANVDLDELMNFHKKHGKMVTVTAVRPPARFGELTIDNDTVVEFKEKPQINEGWINGGFFIIEPKFLEFIKNDSTILEQDPLFRVAAMGEMMAYKHFGFWQCMDTKRDKEFLNNCWQSGKPLWRI